MLKNNKYEFWTISKKALWDDDPIVPIKDIKISWKKDAVKNYKENKTSGRLDICSGISNQTQLGWVMKSWCDFMITLDHHKGTIQVGMPAKNPNDVMPEMEAPLGFFEKEIFTDVVETVQGTFPILMKIHTPWRFSCPEGWGLMMAPLQYHAHKEFFSATGILEPENISEIHVILHIRTDKKEFKISKGQPLCHLIPVPLENFSYTCREATDVEKEYNEAVGYLFQTYKRVPKPALKKLHAKFFWGVENED